MSGIKELVAWLYLVNATLLATHEIDSAFWHEWDLFRLPGGIQLFLVLNLLLLLVVFFGFRRVVLWQRGAKTFSFLLAGAGVFAFSIHMIFIAGGYPAFRLPLSVALLSGTLLVSIAQALLVARIRN
jgi:Family of unknown function (DUF6713)